MLVIRLKDFAEGGRLLGTRLMALPLRDRIDCALDNHEIVEIDFSGTNPTQSFVDELVGTLVLERGGDVLDSLVMKNCSDDVKAILHFVVSDRLDQLAEHPIASGI